MSQNRSTNPNRNNANKQNVAGLEVRLVAANLLTHVLDNHANLDDLTDSQRGFADFLKLDLRDQGLAKAIVLTTLRKKTRIDAILKNCWDRKPPQKARFLMHVLETAAAQILFMDVPQSAAVNLAVTAIRKDKRTTRFASFTNAVLRKLTREAETFLARSVTISPFPQWMHKQLSKDFGKEKVSLSGATIALEPVVDLQGEAGALAAIENTISLPTGARRLTVSTPIRELEGYEKGQWWVQDIAASQPVQLLGNVEGKSIADLCAAPGGKTMQLAKAGAKVTAVDISSRRLQRLEENLKRTHCTAQIVQTDILEWEPSEKFDAVLLDAPCSATGTIRRHPDILWNTTPDQINQLVQLQIQLIEKAALFVKPGGILIYANCSLFKQEGENLIASLKTENLTLDPIKAEELPGLEVCINGQGAFRALPHHLSIDPEEKSGMDGFFAARFIVGS